MYWRIFSGLLLALFMTQSFAGSTSTTLNADIENAKSDIEEVLNNLEINIKRAHDKLTGIEKMSQPDQDRAINEVFFGFKKMVIESLESVNSNSPVMDALHGAYDSTARLKGWFERQPDDYPHRDEFVARLDQALDQYKSVQIDVKNERDRALRQLSELGSAHDRALMAAKVGQVEVSVNAIESVVASMRDLNTGLGGILQKLEDDSLKTQDIAQ